ncbi:hypothetical protein AAC57_001239 [Salmonella enterica subsp. enterica]|nr:hypothetical protein [Salmonella enterica subsp. enterica]EDT8816307.1 hypothetical protein [Salmonella enterica subsp. enterica]EDV5683019.1 hypothetical protein [Salmonella enterica subsp. enterica]TBO19218.1 hypothetical protein EYZ44_13410 [Salmonella enterica subsp. enterica serovar Ouakam]TBO32270.1 hypothetical protein EYZ42_13315 [Salmonella enterica subsp. enterica serovar Ouakam]
MICRYSERRGLSRLALRLAGLRSHSRLLFRSPGKAFTPRPGKIHIIVPPRIARRFVHGSRFAG